MKLKTEFIFENETLLAVSKPSGLLSVPDRFQFDKPSLFGQILDVYPDARPLHRLDFETSGIMLFCLSPDAFGWYSEQFEHRKTEKHYLTIVEGSIREEHGTIDQPLYTQETGKVIISKRGKDSLTHWKVLERFKGHTFLEAHPVTGRTHQIRVHLAYLNHPVVADPFYGKKEGLFLSALKGRKKYKLPQEAEQERPLLGRLALHSSYLAIDDFQSLKKIEITCDLPKDMNAALRQLRQWTSR